MESISIAKDYISHAESLTEKLYIRASSYLRVAARVCLLAWFIDDNLYKCINWSFNLKFVGNTWGSGYFIASTVIFINIMGVFVACLLIVIQKKLAYACGFLLYVILLQTVTLMAASFLSLKMILREFSVVGSLFMILAESQTRDHAYFAEIPPEEERRRSLLQLCGRCLLVLMFIDNIQSQRSSLPLIMQDVVAGTLMVLVTLGYKTRLSALALAVLLTTLNFFNNDWWNSSQYMNYIKYDFFQALTVVGGLLMVTMLGPGSISVDETKKLL